MKMKKSPVSIIIGAIIMITGCLNPSDSPEVITYNGTTPKCVGLWKTRLQFIDIIHYNILLDLNIKPAPDTTYSMVGISESTHDTILAHTGSWNLNTTQDSILLNGNSCRIIDTTLKQLVSRNCVPIKTSVNISSNEWTIQMSELLPLAELMSITIPPFVLPTLQQMPVILTKQ